MRWSRRGEFNAKTPGREDAKRVLNGRSQSVELGRMVVEGGAILANGFASWRLGGFALRLDQSESVQSRSRRSQNKFRAARFAGCPTLPKSQTNENYSPV
jgi:hypothetical protein